MTTVDTIVFDCGDTLLALDPPREVICRDALADLGIQTVREDVALAYRMVDFGYKQRSSRHQTEEDRIDFYREFNRRLCHALGIASRAEEVHQALTEAFSRRRSWTPVPGTTGALQRLAGDFALFVLANWADDLEELLSETGLRPHFDGVYASAQLGAEKPDPEIFDAFAKRSGRDPARCIYVGNEYTADVVGSRARGFTPILLDHAGYYSPRIDARYATSWDEVLAAIRQVTGVPGGL